MNKTKIFKREDHLEIFDKEEIKEEEDNVC